MKFIKMITFFAKNHYYCSVIYTSSVKNAFVLKQIIQSENGKGC